GAPAVPRLVGRGELADGRPFLLLERLHGTSLDAHLAGLAGPPALDWALATADAILAGLERVHAAGLVHGDPKPDNVFLVAGAALLRRRLADARAASVGFQRPIAAPPAPSPRPHVAERRPIVILVAETPAPVVGVAEAMTRQGGFVARQAGERFVCAFPTLG